MLRVTSASVLGPVVLAAAYLGGWTFLILCGLGALGIFWEWSRLTDSAEPLVVVPGVVALVAALVFTGLGHAAAAAAAVLIGAIAAGNSAASRGALAGQRT